MAAYTAIDDSSLFFTPVIWTGSGAQQTISVPFQADFIWVKNRGATINHASQDSVIGFGTRLSPNRNVAEGSEPHGIGTVSASGFNFQGTYDGNGYNESSATYVAWCWKESATAGFDIVSYTGNGSNRTISHSLSATPDLVIIKRRSDTGDWLVGGSTTLGGDNKLLLLNTNAALDDNSEVYQSFSSSTFGIGVNAYVNTNTSTQIAYLWRSVQGFSKFGSYTSNGNADGPFIFTGFRPAFIMYKNISSSASWLIHDSKRLGYNVNNDEQHPDTNAADGTDDRADILSNGFKIREDSTILNTGTDTIIYAAFAEAPFVNSNGVPCNAR
jgi:hypothetical protein